MMTEANLRLLEVFGVWAAAGATIAAVVLALFLQQIQERRRRPKVEVLYDRDSPADNRYLSPTTDASGPGNNRHELWLRLRVRNSSKFPAHDVELKMTTTHVSNEGTQQNRPGWSFKVSNLDAVRTTIHPGFTQYFDIAFLIYSCETSHLCAHLVLTTPDAPEWHAEKARIESSNEYTGMKIGWPYQVCFAVVGTNLDATYYRMAVQFTPLSAEHNIEANLKQCLVAGQPTKITSDIAFEWRPNVLSHR